MKKILCLLFGHKDRYSYKAQKLLSDGEPHTFKIHICERCWRERHEEVE